MARKTAFVPNATTGVISQVALADIPQDVRDEVEEIYAALKANPNGRMRSEFDTVEELRQYVTQVVSYCEQRPAGAIRFRKSPTKKLPDTVVEFRITDLQSDSEAQTADIREEMAKVNDASGAVPAKKATPAKK